MNKIVVSPNTTVAQTADKISEKSDYDFEADSNVSERIHNEAVANEGVLIFDSWFAHKEMNGMTLMAITDIGAETDDAIRVKGRNVEDLGDTAHFQTTYTGWVPKSVIQTQVE